MKNFKLWGSVGAIIIIAVLVMVFYSNRSDSPAVEGKVPAPVTETDWTHGSAEAKVTLVEYADFQCPACAAYYPSVKALKEKYGEAGKLRTVFRHFPLVQIHFNAALSAQAAEAAGKQGKFWDMHDKLFEGQEMWASGDARNIFFGYARDLGLDEARFTADLESKEALQKISDSFKEGRNAGVIGTPTFFLNGKILDGVRSPQELEKAVTQAVESAYPEAI